MIEVHLWNCPIVMVRSSSLRKRDVYCGLRSRSVLVEGKKKIRIYKLILFILLK